MILKSAPGHDNQPPLSAVVQLQDANPFLAPLLTFLGTVEVVEKLVGGAATATEASAAEPVTEAPKVEPNGVNGTNGATKEDTATAEVAAEVADTAEKLDSNEAKTVAA